MPTLTDQLELPASIGAALRRQRQTAGLTTAEVADAAGINPWLLFLIENAQRLSGTSGVEVRAGIERICRVLETDPEPLLALAEAAVSAGPASDPPTLIVPLPSPTNSPATSGQTDEPIRHNLVAPPAGSDISPRPAGRHGGGVRVLRLASAAVALAVVACAVALALASEPTPGIRPPTAAAASARTVARPAPRSGPAVPGLKATSPDSATLTMGAAHYSFTVTAAAPCWVEIRSAGGSVLWAGTLSGGQQEAYAADQPTEVLLGAGSARLTVSWGSHHYTLAPPAAPYTYSFQS